MGKTIDQRQKEISRRKQRFPRKSPKKEVSDLCSRYIRLRDALDYCKRMRIDISQFNSIKDLPVQCCTCEKVKSWPRMQAGHYFGRGLGGSSGAYFDERNINTQCGQCNCFKGGNIQVYTEFMREKYGQEVIDQLRIKHHCVKKWTDLDFIPLGKFYKDAYNELCEQK